MNTINYRACSEVAAAMSVHVYDGLLSSIWKVIDTRVWSQVDSDVYWGVGELDIYMHVRSDTTDRINTLNDYD